MNFVSNMAESSNEQQLPDWNQPCLEEHLAEIATSIVEWREISPFLGLTEAEEHEILGSIPPLTVLSQKIAMLRLWKKKKGKTATYKRLCIAFKKSNQLGLEDEMKQILAESVETDSASVRLDDNKSKHINLLAIIIDCTCHLYFPVRPHTGVPANEQHSDPIASYASYLKELYMSMSHSHTSQQWTHLPRCEFIQLAMIGEEIRRGEPEEEMIRLAQQGKIETILRHKENISLDHLFGISRNFDFFPPQPPPSPSSSPPNAALEKNSQDPLEGLRNSLLSLLRPNPRTILIEGAPGVGKSTLALHICHQWAHEVSWLERFDLIILAYLRDEAVQRAKTLADILPAAVEVLVSASYGDGVLFIFDGWDEFPPNLMNNSLVSTIIHQPYKLSLHLSTVLITSRPVSSGNLLHLTDRRVEILGFAQYQIREYIEQALDGNKARIQKLVHHLEEHPVIEGYCYLPLHVAILVHVFLTMKGVLPTTLHELLCSLVLCSIVREQATHKLNALSLPEFLSLDKLPDDLKSKLSNLCALAYNGVLQDKVVFYSKDLEEFRVPSNLSSLGLLQAVEGLTLCSKSLSYNFIHLSVQELLAAYYISQMDPNAQVEIFKMLFESSRFRAVLHYYCGFTKLDNPEIKDFISSCQIRKSNFEDLLPLFYCFYEAQQPSLCQLVDSRFIPNEHQKLYAKDLSPVDFLVIGYFLASLLSSSNTPPMQFLIDGIDDHCLKMLLNELARYQTLASYAYNHLPLKLVLFNPSFTGRACTAPYFKTSSAVSELVLSYSKSYLYSINFFAVGYFITSFLSTSSTTNTPPIHLVIDGIDDHHLRMLLNELSTTHQILTSSLRLDLHRPSITEQGMSHIAYLLRTSTIISELVLADSDFRSYSVLLPIAEALETNTSLIKLSLTCLRLNCTEKDGSVLIKMFKANESLTQLDLSNNSMLSNSGAHWIFEGLQHNTTLVILNLSNTGIAIDPDSARSLIKMLQINKSLTHLDLSKNTISDSAICWIFEYVQHNTTLVNLNLSDSACILSNPETARSLTKMLKTNKSLTHLDLSKNTLLDSAAQSIFVGLQQNTAVVNLNLSDTGITVADLDTASSLTKMLKINKSLTHLNLSKNLLSDLAAECICLGLQHNTALVSLNLSYTDITATDPDTARSLTKMLQVNKSLAHLDLSNHNFRYARMLIFSVLEGLKHNCALRYLDLHAVTGITDDAAEHIAQALLSKCTLQTLNISECRQFLLQTMQTIFIKDIGSKTLSAFKRAREANNLPPVAILIDSVQSVFESDLESSGSESD